MAILKSYVYLFVGRAFKSSPSLSGLKNVYKNKIKSGLRIYKALTYVF